MTFELRPYLQIGPDAVLDAAVPDHWERMRIKHLADLRSGQSITSEAIDPEGRYPVYGGNGLRGYTSSFTHDGQFVLIGRQGALCGNINYADGQFWASEHAVVATPVREFDRFWFGELLRHMDLNQYSISAAQPGLAVERIRNLEVPVPPLLEQAAIPRFLRHKTKAVSAFIRNKRRLIALLNEEKQAIVQQAVTRGLDPNVAMKPSGVEWLGKIPAHWDVTRIKNLARLQSGESITSEQIGDTGEFPVFGGNGFRGYTLSYTHNGKFVLIGRQGALCGNINYAEDKFWASEHAVVAHPVTDYNVRWFGELLRSMNLNQYSIAAAQPGLAMDRIRNLQLPVPPRAEQDSIAGFIAKETSQIEQAVGTAQREIDLIREYRTRLIADVVTGQLDVREAAASLPDIEDEEVEPALGVDEVLGEGEEFSDDESDAIENADAAD